MRENFRQGGGMDWDYLEEYATELLVWCLHTAIALEPIPQDATALVLRWLELGWEPGMDQPELGEELARALIPRLRNLGSFALSGRLYGIPLPEVERRKAIRAFLVREPEDWG